jgi:hypothetical protein
MPVLSHNWLDNVNKWLNGTDKKYQNKQINMLNTCSKQNNICNELISFIRHNFNAIRRFTQLVYINRVGQNKLQAECEESEINFMNLVQITSVKFVPGCNLIPLPSRLLATIVLISSSKPLQVAVYCYVCLSTTQMF